MERLHFPKRKLRAPVQSSVRVRVSGASRTNDRTQGEESPRSYPTARVHLGQFRPILHFVPMSVDRGIRHEATFHQMPRHASPASVTPAAFHLVRANHQMSLEMQLAGCHTGARLRARETSSSIHA